MPKYILDTNFFIQAHRSYYPMDIFVSFWEKIKDLAENGILISIDKVKDEIFVNEDELKGWCESNLPDDFFQDSIVSMYEYKHLSEWARSRSDHYHERAINEFLRDDKADAFLISYSLHAKDDHILITLEKGVPERKNRIMIPDVCNAFSINYKDPIAMLRELKEKL